MIILQILLLLKISYATEVLIKAEGAESFQYDKFLQEHPSKLSYVQYLTKQTNKEKILREKTKKAQFHFLEGSLEEARKLFIGIANQRWDKGWQEQERKIFIYSLWRLAQLERKKQEGWLSQALSYDPEVSIKENLFPPPLVALYKQLKKASKEKLYPLPEFAQNFDKITINGKALAKGTSFFKTSEGKKHFAFLSNTYKPIFMVDHPEKISQEKLKKQAMVRGNCQSPQILQSFAGTPAYAFFSEKCILPARGQLQSLLPSTFDRTEFNEKPTSTAWKRSTWLWIGASIVGAFATYKVLESQRGRAQQRVEIQPSSQYLSNTSSHQ